VASSPDLDMGSFILAPLVSGLVAEAFVRLSPRQPARVS
jgi:hypothetical protein